MNKRGLIVIASAGSLAIVTAALAFAAEAKRVKVSDVELTNYGTCTYPRSPALALGLTAAVAILVAQVIVNTAAGCICCRKHPHPSSTNWTVAFVSFILSWITFIIAFLLLLMGAALNDQRGEEQMYFGNYCFVVKAGVFSAGALLSVASVCLGSIYFYTLSAAKCNRGAWVGEQPALHQGGIALGQQQFQSGTLTSSPQQQQLHHHNQPQQPVFVPEDTYNRQQQQHHHHHHQPQQPVFVPEDTYNRQQFA